MLKLLKICKHTEKYFNYVAVRIIYPKHQLYRARVNKRNYNRPQTSHVVRRKSEQKIYFLERATSII